MLQRVGSLYYKQAMARTKNGVANQNSKRPNNPNNRRNKPINKQPQNVQQPEDPMRKLSVKSINSEAKNVGLPETFKPKPAESLKVGSNSIEVKPAGRVGSRPKGPCDTVKLQLVKENLQKLENIIQTYDDVFMDDEIRIPYLLSYFENKNFATLAK